MQVPLMRLQCGCNSYEWGKPGRTSAAAKYASATNFAVQVDKPYAELWMGTHPSLPSRDLSTQRTLLDLVRDNQALLSPDISAQYGHKLPFLFKVLSISKALSIQAHPNKKLAGQLHARDPKNYPDDNHKPEMTIALTPFTGLCGFRPLAEISQHLTSIPPLRALIDESAVTSFLSTTHGQETSTSPPQISKNKTALRTLFTALMTSATTSPSTLQAQTAALLALAGADPSPLTPALASLVRTLNTQFPGDVGLFIVFLLNHVSLAPGEAMFLRADDIHAYLSGDIVECMASSDNVVRAGFTPKFKDVSTLADMLTYDYAGMEAQKMRPVDWTRVRWEGAGGGAGGRAGEGGDSTAAGEKGGKGTSDITLYDPPIDEFAVLRAVLRHPNQCAVFDPISGPSILICTGGAGTIAVGPTVEEVKEGYVFFVGATAEVALESAAGAAEEETPFVTFRAFCEIGGGGRAKANGSM